MEGEAFGVVDLNLENAPLREQLRHFRATHTDKRYQAAGHEWRYLAGGKTHEEALLLLPGAPGLGEMAFQHIMRFEHTYHVIAPSYPPGITTIDQLLEGIIALLDHEQVQRAHVVGGSYSGMVAQCLVRRSPQRVRTLILDHTNPPSRERAREFKCYCLIFTLLPLKSIRLLLQLGTALLSRGVSVQQLFWHSYFEQGVIAKLTKEDYMSRIQVGIDFHTHATFTQNDLATWSGKLLIIEADNDTYVSVRERTALKALYPSAQVYTFARTGHAAWANQFETFYSIIAHFLQEAS
jgi:pimeloyl-ACP methyl ester carboxylesterase